MLLIFNRSPWQCNSNEIFRMMNNGDDLLLTQDGVLAAINSSFFIKNFFNQTFIVGLFALKEDIEARGISYQISNKVVMINYSYFVKLVVKHVNQITW